MAKIIPLAPAFPVSCSTRISRCSKPCRSLLILNLVRTTAFWSMLMMACLCLCGSTPTNKSPGLSCPNLRPMLFCIRMAPPRQSVLSLSLILPGAFLIPHTNDKGCCAFCLIREPRTIHVGLLTLFDHLPQNFGPHPDVCVLLL